MKHWNTVLACLTIASLAFAGTAVAQEAEVFHGDSSTYGGAPNYPLIFGFESLEADTLFWGHYGFDQSFDRRDYAYWANYADFGGDPQNGNGALWLDWSFFTDADWGGSSALQHWIPVADSTTMQPDLFYDFSDFTHINLWYNTLVPAEPPANFRLKMQDGSEGIGTRASSETEDWYLEDGNMYQAQPGWNKIVMPLESLGNVAPGNGGFSRPGCPGSCWSGIYGNGELDLDKITGFQMEFTGPQYGAADDSSTAGTIVFDNFHVSGIRYNLMENFEDGEGRDGGWQNSNGGSHSIAVNPDTTEGAGSLQIDYNIVGDQGWGGSVDSQFLPSEATYGQMSARTHISLFYKVLVPADGPASVTFRLWDTSDGNREQWDYVLDIMADSSGQWRRALIPFNEMTSPSWAGPQDGILDQNTIVETLIQIAVPEGATAAGSILFDRMTGYGFQETDFVAPEAVTGLVVATSDYANVIGWTDVDGEEGESYTIYASESPITDVMADGVAVVATVAEGTEVFLDNLYYPVDDGSVTKYYAITASDSNLNVSEPTILTDAVTNMGRGITTIALASPAFVADGDLSEWAGITPIHMEVGDGITNQADVVDPSGPEDLSADTYVAMDTEYLYVGMDITDDLYDPVENAGDGEQWLKDVAEFYIGLYDGRAGKHANYQIDSEESDYKFNFYSFNISDGGDIDIPLGENYYVGARQGGWVIEARIALADMQRDGFDLFVPEDGMRVPLDIVIMDDDTPGGGNRETIMTYSPDNDDNSYLSPLNWFYTWIGTRYATGIETVSTDVPREFRLHGNYPNPFNPTTLLRYDLPQSGKVTMDVFNVLGQHVQTLVNTDQAAGTYEVRFDATQLASGMYLVHLRAGGNVQTIKMMLVR